MWNLCRSKFPTRAGWEKEGKSCICSVRRRRSLWDGRSLRQRGGGRHCQALRARPRNLSRARLRCGKLLAPKTSQLLLIGEQVVNAGPAQVPGGAARAARSSRCAGVCLPRLRTRPLALEMLQSTRTNVLRGGHHNGRSAILTSAVAMSSFLLSCSGFGFCVAGRLRPPFPGDDSPVPCTG